MNIPTPVISNNTTADSKNNTTNKNQPSVIIHGNLLD